MPPLATDSVQATHSSPRPLSPQWWVRDGSGNVSVAQWPNPALVVWLLALVVGWTGVMGAGRAATLDAVGSGALVAWALDELVRGTSPVRRLLGAVVLAAELVRLFG